MNDRAEMIRRRIAHYRRLLAEGVDVDLARQYLADIVAAEAQLAEIESQDHDKRS